MSQIQCDFVFPDEARCLLRDGHEGEHEGPDLPPPEWGPPARAPSIQDVLDKLESIEHRLVYIEQQIDNGVCCYGASY